MPKSSYNLALKISPKGAVSVYGMGRFPVTLYADQMDAILSKADAIRSFMKAHASELKAKPESNGGPQGATAI
jgi:hypothetical protein